MVIHVVKPRYVLLEEALAGGNPDRAKVEQVRNLLRDNGGGEKEEDMARIAQLEAEVARLNEELGRERSWGSAMMHDVVQPGYRLLEEALATGQLDRAKVEQVRNLLRDNGGRD